MLPFFVSWGKSPFWFMLTARVDSFRLKYDAGALLNAFCLLVVDELS